MDVKQMAAKATLRLAALIGILIAFTLIINLSWFDEELHPDLARMLPPQPVSMDGNAYPNVYGFLAAEGLDPHAIGVEIIDLLRQRFARGERANVTVDEMVAINGDTDLTDVPNSTYTSITCNPRFELDCADRLIREVRNGASSDARLNLLFDRYEAILALPRFEENQEFDAYTPLPSYGGLMQIGRIWLATSFSQKSTSEFLDDVAEDIRFWKTMLRDGQALVAKMVALAGLRNDTQFLSALMHERNLSPEDLSTIGDILTPFTDEERDIGETFLTEARIALLTDKSLAILVEGPSALTRLALQQNATLNENYYTTTIPIRLRAALSASEFFKQRAYEDLSYDVRILPPPLYNLGGKIVLKWVTTQIGLTGYISRVHDIDGRIALVLLQAEILANPGRPIDSVISASQHRNPYTLEPMKYDRAAGQIGFECLGNSMDVCAVTLR